MLSTIPQSTGTIRTSILIHCGEGGPFNPCVTSELLQERISKHSKIIFKSSVPKKVCINLTYYLQKKTENPAPPGMAKCQGLLTPSSKFSYSRATGSHLKIPQPADCFCLCSTGLVLLFLKDFVIERTDVSLLWSQCLFFVELLQEFLWTLPDLHTQNQVINQCVMPFRWQDI